MTEFLIGFTCGIATTILAYLAGRWSVRDGEAK